jgi:Ca2+/H+ antiporter
MPWLEKHMGTQHANPRENNSLLNLWPGAVAMILFATLTASLVTTSGRSAWFVGVLAIMVYLIFATALYLLPPPSAE